MVILCFQSHGEEESMHINFIFSWKVPLLPAGGLELDAL